MDFAEANRAALARARKLVPGWIPGGKIKGKEYIARNPTRPDENLGSFSINLETGIWSDFATDDSGGNLISLYAYINGLPSQGEARRRIAEELGLDGDKSGKKKTRKKIFATYDYENENGKLLYQVVRYDPKEFRQRRPDGKKWKYNLDGVTRVPYNLPNIIKQEAAVVCEGEKDANRLIDLGFPATTFAGARWRPEYAKRFEGKHLYLFPDNDIPGRNFMKTIADAMVDKAASIKMVALPGLPQKGDVSDYLDDMGDDKKWVRDAIWDLIGRTPLYEHRPADESEPDDLNDDHVTDSGQDERPTQPQILIKIDSTGNLNWSIIAQNEAEEMEMAPIVSAIQPHLTELKKALSGITAT